MQNENLLSGHYEKEWNRQSREVTSLPLLDWVLFFSTLPLRTCGKISFNQKDGLCQYPYPGCAQVLPAAWGSAGAKDAECPPGVGAHLGHCLCLWAIPRFSQFPFLSAALWFQQPSGGAGAALGTIQQLCPSTLWSLPTPQLRYSLFLHFKALNILKASLKV